MKKAILLTALLGIVVVLTSAKFSFFQKQTISTSILEDDDYKNCIEVCDSCIISCKRVEFLCAKDSDLKMASCAKICNQCAASCSEAVKMMKENNANAKQKCRENADICKKCAIECDKFTMSDFKKCASNCRNAAKHCSRM